MIEINGEYSDAKIMSDDYEENACNQIKELCDQKFTEGAKVRVMPDYHAGKGCVIGFTADLGDLVVPNLVGVDLGCAIRIIDLGKIDLDFKKLDNIIHKYVPSGRNVHEGRVARFKDIQDLKCYRSIKDTRKVERGIGTLGGGNHFIEIDVDDSGNYYLVIHTGSRNLGVQTAEYYQNLAIDLSKGKEEYFLEKDRIIKEYKEQGRRTEIQDALKQLSKEFKEKEAEVPPDVAYLYGKYRDMYLHDINIVQRYSKLNRETIANLVLENYFGKTLNDFDWFESMHNYVDLDMNIIRKGAVSAKDGERLIIPINMRDGSLICTGKGDDEWNQSAPHGAGRIVPRHLAKDVLNMDEYKKSMEGIYTTCITETTLDESPMAYKSMDHILKNIQDTARVDKIIKPVYNFKAI